MAPATRAVGGTTVDAAPVPRLSWLERFERWCWRQEQKRIEDYLARSVDAADLEQRVQFLARRTYSL